MARASTQSTESNVARKVRRIVNVLTVVGIIGALGLAAVGLRELPDAAVWGRLLIGIGLGGALALCATFLLPLGLRANLMLMGTVSLVALWTASYFLYDPRSPGEVRQDRLEAAANKAGVSFDGRTRIEMIEDLRQSGIEAYPPLAAWAFIGEQHPETPRLDVLPIVPLAGPSRTTTVLCNENGEYLIVETDRYGFNNPESAYSATSPVLLLGDSFTFGYCVTPGKDVASLLRVNGTELVNLGYPGSGPLMQLAQLREYGNVLRPRTVVWLYYNGNDLTNLRDEYQASSFRRYLEPDHRQSLATRQSEVDAFWAESMDWNTIRSRHASRSASPIADVLLLEPLRTRLRALPPRNGDSAPTPHDSVRTQSDRSLEQFDAVLQQMISETNELGARLYFVFLPTYAQFIDGDPRRRDEVLASVAARGVPIVDFEMRLRDTGDPLRYYPFREHGHFNEAGFALLADEILANVDLGVGPEDPEAADSAVP